MRGAMLAFSYALVLQRYSMSADIDLINVTIRFGDFTAVRDVSLKDRRAANSSPSSAPRAAARPQSCARISGFLDADSSGKVRIGGKDMAGVGAQSSDRPRLSSRIWRCSR